METNLEINARKKSRELFAGEHGNVKAEVWICGNIKLHYGKETKCWECGDVCYYDTKLKLKTDKNHIKICINCALKNHFEDMTALEQELLRTNESSRN